MLKIKNWVEEEKKHIRFYHDWNDKEVLMCSSVNSFSPLDPIRNGFFIKNFISNSSQIEVLNKYLFLTSKPMIYLVNLSEKDYIRKKNKWYVCFHPACLHVAYINLTVIAFLCHLK